MIRFLAAVLLLSATAAYVAFSPPGGPGATATVLAAVPDTLGGWHGVELGFDEAVLEDLAPDDLLVRRYDRDDARIWLTIVYHRNRRYGAHDAQLCYRSEGYVVTPRQTRRIADGSAAGLTVNRFVAEREGRRRLVYYWWSTRGLTTAEVGDFRDRMALGGLLENQAWGAFIRLETPFPAGHETEAEAALAGFAAAVAGELPAVFVAGEIPRGR